ncbi:MAG TPA: carboxypeptidase-like regulatory domain-containing protein, partial [Desulfobaccales bacterium]|nr:carboxypeptidase-like regulatory domain-containing protein [Desulfobaccales bacterium]
KRLGAVNTQVTTTTNSYTVTAAPNRNEYTWPMLSPISFPMPGGISRVGSRINVYFDGNVNLRDIYNAIVAAGYSTHAFWDGINFVLNGSIYITGSIAGSLIAKGVTIILLGTIYNTNPNCIITLGESIGNSYRYPTTLTFLHYAAAAGSSWGANLALCGVRVSGKGSYGTTPFVLGDIRFAPNGTIFKDVVLLDGAMFDSAWIDLNRISTPIILITTDTQVTWDMNIIYPGPGVYPNSNAYGKHYRMSFDSTGASDLMCKSHVSITYHLSMYDIYCPFRQNNLPVIDWTKYGSDTIWPTVFLYHTCLLRVADQDGNAVSGATVTLKDSGGATEKTAATNTDGYFLDETIAITAATTTTITDSSKSWTADAHRGKEIIITSGVNAGQRCVVKSNTATQLTLMDALATACSAGDRAGFPFYALRCAIDHDPSKSGGVGAGFQIITDKNPHTLTITKAGFQDYQEILSINRKMDLEVALGPVPPPEYVNVPSGEVAISLSAPESLEVSLEAGEISLELSEDR